MRIFLTGFMGSGKTTVGRLLAERLGVEFIDLDSRIESRSGLTVKEIFESEGEEAFRGLESEALEEVRHLEAAVVATGGGLPMRESNVRRMRSLGRTVWLDVPFEVVIGRLGDRGWSERPLLGGREEARRLLDRRRDRYVGADLRVEIEADETPDEVVSRILRLLSKCVT